MFVSLEDAEASEPACERNVFSTYSVALTNVKPCRNL